MIKDNKDYFLEDLHDDLDAYFNRLRHLASYKECKVKDLYLCKLYHMSCIAKDFLNTMTEFLNMYSTNTAENEK